MGKIYFKEEDFGMAKSEKNTKLLPYVLEVRDPEVEIHLVHLLDISLIVIPSHRIAYWGERNELEKKYTQLGNKWDDIRFDQDQIISMFPLSTVDYYPGDNSKVNSLACSINHLQAFNKNRNLFSQKEFSPSSIKKNLGQYDTPFWLAKFSITELSNAEIFADSENSYLDPMAGEGSFLEASLHVWIIQSLKQNLKPSDYRDHTCNEANKILLKNFKNGKILGVESDVKRASLLNKHFFEIFKKHNLNPYTVALAKDFFEVNREDIKASKIVFIGNPCWDVIETTNTVRSRTKSAIVVEGAKPKKEKLLQEKTILDFEKKFQIKCSNKDYRNIYSLTIAKCLTLGNGEATFSMVLPKGILGDITTSQLRNLIGEFRPQLFIDEFKNCASGARIFPAVDARVQFCVITVIPTDKITKSFKTRKHGVDFNPKRKYVDVSWLWGEKRFTGTNQWIVFKDTIDKAVANKVTKYPSLEAHSELEFEAGATNVSDFFLEGKDIECFKVRKQGQKSKNNNRILVRKILPNGGRKLIAATDCGLANIKDSLISIKVGSTEDHVFYILGVLNSEVGEYRLRLTQSNINLNLWKLKQLHLPEYDKSISLHKEIASTAKSLSKKWDLTKKNLLDQLVQNLFGLTSQEANYISNEMMIPERAA